VTNRTLVEQKVTRTYVKHWDGQGAWQTVQRRTHTFVDKPKKVPEVDEQEDNVRCCPEVQVVQLEDCIGMPQRPHTGNSPNIIHSSTKQTPRFIDETELRNNETRCSSKNFHLTCSEEHNYMKYGQLTGLLSYQHQPTIGSSTHPINNRCLNKNIKPREKSSIGPKTAVPPSQLQSSIRDDENGQWKVQRDVRLAEQRGQQHHRDVVHKSRSYMNTVTRVEVDKVHRPSNKTSLGHQMDVYSSQSESSDDTSALAVRESRRRQRDTIYRRHSFRNDEHTRWAEDPSEMDEEQGMGDRQVLWQVKHLGRYRGAVLGHQTDISLSQVQPAIKANAPGHGETRQRHEDAVYNKRSFMNDNSMRRTGDTAAVKERQGTGNIPHPQLPMRSRTRETLYDGLQMAMPLFQGQPPTQVRNSGYGETRWHHGDGVYNRHSNTNDKNKEKLTNSSVRLQERSTTLYSLTRRPKAPDKHIRRVDDRPPRVTEDSRGDHNGTRTMKHLYMNIEPAVSNDENSRLMKVVVNKRWTAYITPSLTNRSGGTLVTQGSMHSKMRNGYLYDPQTAVPLSQTQPSRGSSNPRYRESRGRPGDARYGGQTRINGKNNCIPKEVINGQWMACCTLSLTNETGYLPGPQL
jgi:hypothetical protein